jgi:ClpP class serine protease
MWLLEDNVLKAMKQAQGASMVPNPEHQANYATEYMAAVGGEDSPRILSIAGNNAEIMIKGVITQEPDFFARIFGGGNITYPEIISAIDRAEQDDSVDNVIFRVDSPGGQFEGLFDVLSAIQGMKKPNESVVSNVAASAAYAIVAQTDKITASNRAVRVGSVGIVGIFGVNDREIRISSTKAPKKAPDVTTESGKAMVREELDSMHDIFTEAIADGRKTTVNKVNTKFGQGGTFLADEALSRDMIDAIEGVKLKVVRANKTPVAKSAGKTEEGKNMDLVTLKAHHADVYAAVREEGVTEERERVVAHMTMGEASGDTKTSTQAIKDGSAFTASIQAAYMAASINRNDINARGDDETTIAAVTAAAAAATEAEDIGSTVAALVEANLGIETEAKING